MKFYDKRIKLKYFLDVENKIYDIEYIGFEYSEYPSNKEYLSYPRYFVFDCKYEYYYDTLMSYNKVMSKKYLQMFIKINLYSDSINYYIKFSDLFNCLNDNLITSMNINDYRELKLYDLYRDVEDLSKYIRINYGLDVRKD